MIKLDTETCGFYGMPVLLQYEIDDYGIVLYDIWKNRIRDTLRMLDSFCKHKGGVLGFNLVFDWFQICKLYTVFDLYARKENGLDHYPEDHVLDIVRYEKEARDGPCLKPVTACDLFLHARKGKYQSTLDRKDIRIRRVPTELAYRLSDELHKRIPLNPLYFARRKTNLENPWQVFDIEDKETGRVVRNFKDIVLKFSPSSALKAIAKDAFGITDVIRYEDIEVHKNLYPKEYGWAPFAEAVENIARPFHSWPAKIKYHIEHWAYNSKAREYAAKDVEYLTRLYPYFGSPEFGDTDSILACQVAAVRWKGFAIDAPKMQGLLDATLAKIAKAPRAPSYVKKYIFAAMSETEQLGFGNSTKKVLLEELATHVKDCECEGEDKTCKICGGTGEYKHPAAVRAQEVLDARSAEKEAEIYEKILQAGRFHASFKIIGALSTRMAGADNLNPQGIKSAKYVRVTFKLAPPGYKLIGGDFEAFEVVIALSIYGDEKLEEDLNQYGLCPGCLGKKKVKKKEKDGSTSIVDCKECNATGKTKKKIHGIFGETIYGMTYDEIVATKGEEPDLYKKSKSGVFSQMYFGNANTLQTRLGIELEKAEQGEKKWKERYPGVARSQQRIIDMFGSMRQPEGLGSKVIWNEPADYIESLLGFRRYFTLENRICREIFTLAENPPKDWLNVKIKVRRRDKDQTAAGAVRSALFGAAFQIQAANVRAAGNHEIQSSGAGITKETQAKIWELQPIGINEFVVMPMNIHDEIMCPTIEGRETEVENIVRSQVDKYKTLVPMLSIDWSNNLETWADK